MLAKKVLTLTLLSTLQHLSHAAAAWATFYNADDCTQQNGGVSYDVTNPGCFFNSGPFLRFHGDTDVCSATLSQFEQDCSTAVKHQFQFDSASSDCFDLENLGFSTGPNGAAGMFNFDWEVDKGGC